MRELESRASEEFHRRLSEVLSHPGENGLTESAIELDEPIDMGGDSELTHCITLDYVGGSASELLDRPGQLLDECCFTELEDLIRSTGKLNDAGYFVKIRLLLLYPYSAAGQIRIQAEESQRRSAVTNPSPNQRQRLREIDSEMIRGSNYLGKVERNLSILQELEENLGEDHPIYSYPNMLEVRFSPVNPMTWFVRANDILFYQPYVYGKEDRYDIYTAGHELPVLELAESDGLAFDLLLDHFRYLWEYDATIFQDDCVEYRPSSLRIKTPDDISFTEKATNHASNMAGNTQKNILQKAEEFKARLDPHSPDLVTPPDEEVAFISNSWQMDTNGKQGPLSEAVELERLLSRFFHDRTDLDGVRDIIPTLVNTPAGERFTERVYDGLDDASIGIVFLTPEISSKDTPRPIASPNVYHELGYLMAKLKHNRTYIFTSPEVEPPSNIQGIVHIPFHDIYHGFVDLLIALEETNVITSHELVTVSEAYHTSLKDIEAVDDKIRGKVQTYIDERIDLDT